MVSIDEAAQIYAAAKHPKSFVPLDRADHLLSNPDDSRYVAEALSAWAIRYLKMDQIPNKEMEAEKPPVGQGSVIVRECDKKFPREILTQHHRIISDEPIALGGADLGLTYFPQLIPVELPQMYFW